LGQYLAPGTGIAVLESTDSVFIDFRLPQQNLPQLREGMAVRASSSGNDGTNLGSGTIAAIDPTVDPVTRTVEVRASVPNTEGKLRPGMFVSVRVILRGQEELLVVPVTSVVRASYGDSVYIVEQKKDEAGQVQSDPEGNPLLIARQTFVKLGATRGDFVSIAEGIEAGQEVVTGGSFKLHNGSGIRIDNSVKAEAEVEPHPENR
jgi:membrane fusion protein (multidrug efflux system)